MVSFDSRFEREKILLCDPFGKDIKGSKRACISLTKFFKLRAIKDGFEDVVWKPETMEYPTQGDSCNCGIFCLKIAETFLSKRTLPEYSQTKLPNEVSFEGGRPALSRSLSAYAGLILSSLEDLENVCPAYACNRRSTGGRRKWVTRDHCVRWYYWRCTIAAASEGNKELSTFQDAKKCSWKCPLYN